MTLYKVCVSDRDHFFDAKDGVRYCVRCGLITELNSYLSKPKKKAPLEKKCVTCGSLENLSRHHIIPKALKRHTKLITLCRTCHNVADILAWTIYKNQAEIDTQSQ